MSGQSNDFLRSLALHTQMLACLQWLAEFQVLACVPLDDPVPLKDIADVCGVPETQLARVASLMATAGFFDEPRPGHVAHSPLSAQFVTEPALLDAALFLAGTAAPAALQMPLATKQFPASDRADQCAFAAAAAPGIPLAREFALRPRLQRQFAAYLRCLAGDDHAAVRDALLQFDWAALGDATVVDIAPPSTTTATALATLFPSLHLIIQTPDPLPSPPPAPLPGTTRAGVCLTAPTADAASTTGPAPPAGPSPDTPASPSAAVDIPPDLRSRITLQPRAPGTAQFVRAAAVYVVHVPAPSPTVPWAAVSARAVAELTAHLDVLRANAGAARVLLTAVVVPERGGVDGEVEAAARVRDLSLLQLANGRLAGRGDVVALVEGVRDRAGGLVVVEEMGVGGRAVGVWVVRYAMREGRG